MFSCYVSSVSHPFVFFCKQKTAYEMRISESSDVCSSDLRRSICGSHAAADQQLFRRRCRRPCVAGAAQLREPGRCHGRCAGGTWPLTPPGRQLSGDGRTAILQPGSDERRVGKECGSTCCSRGSPAHHKHTSADRLKSMC